MFQNRDSNNTVMYIWELNVQILWNPSNLVYAEDVYQTNLVKNMVYYLAKLETSRL